MGGAVNGDQYHNILFQNPGQGNHWLAVKLVGKKTNRAAIGARIKVVTAGEQPLTVHRHVSSGSSFGGQPARADTSAWPTPSGSLLLEIHWPTSGTTQVFHDIAANQAIEVVEFADEYRKRDYRPIAGRAAGAVEDRVPGCALPRLPRAPRAAVTRRCRYRNICPASDRLESVPEVFDSGWRPIVGPDDRHDVETAADFQHIMPAA